MKPLVLLVFLFSTSVHASSVELYNCIGKMEVQLENGDIRDHILVSPQTTSIEWNEKNLGQQESDFRKAISLGEAIHHSGVKVSSIVKGPSYFCKSVYYSSTVHFSSKR